MIKLVIPEINIDINLNQISMPKSIIDYNHKKAVWSGGGSFSSRQKISDEEHIITISPKLIKDIFTKIIYSIKKKTLTKELQGYKKILDDYKNEYLQKFEEFEKQKQNEVLELKKSLSDVLKNLEITNKQLLVLEGVKNDNK